MLLSNFPQIRIPHLKTGINPDIDCVHLATSAVCRLISDRRGQRLMYGSDGAITRWGVRGREQTRWTGNAWWVAYCMPIKAIT